jgi:Tfp pilus assembly protein PilX
MVNNKKNKSGYTLLVSTLLSSLLLSIGLSIVSINAKEIKLSSITKDSQLAFYAADIGVECAIYWDLKYGSGISAFATSTASIPPPSNIRCNNNNINTAWTIQGDDTSATTTFPLDLGVSGNSRDICAEVAVIKTNDGASTTIESRGRNFCNNSNLRRVERALRVRY